MKNSIFTLLFFSLLTHVNAQTHSEAFRYSDHQFVGTARSAAMSNAFGALGADMSTLSNNPAGLGLYQSIDFSFSLNLGSRDMTSYYSGNKVRTSIGQLNLSSLGMVIPYSANSTSDWRRQNFGFAYNSSNTFRSRTVLGGRNLNSSMVDSYLGFASGKMLNDLNEFYEFGAFEVDLIDLSLNADSSDWIDDGNFYREVGVGQNQYKRIDTYGSSGEFAISYAASYQDYIYLGATLGLTHLEYTENSRYNENGFQDTSTTVQSFDVYDNLYTTGSGVNLKLGAIIRASENIRLGIAWHSPTFYDMKDEWEMSIKGNHSFNDSAYSYSYTSPYGLYSYRLQTPMKFQFSGAFIINKMLALSGDVEYLDYSKMQFDGSAFEYFNTQNNEISYRYDATYNTKVGAELNLSPFLIRAGYAKYGNPVKTSTNNDVYNDPYRNERKSYSFGVGKRGEYNYIDLAYVFTEQSYGDWLYNANFIEPYKKVNTFHNFVFTMGWKF